MPGISGSAWLATTSPPALTSAMDVGPAALWPILEDGQPATYEWHRKWWGIRVRKSGGLLQVYLDNKLVLETEDTEPLPGGRVGIWTLRNDIITPRIKVYFEDEKRVRSPLPDEQRQPLRPVQTAQRLLGLSSSTHPSVQNDFEAGLEGIAGRDDCERQLASRAPEVAAREFLRELAGPLAQQV